MDDEMFYESLKLYAETEKETENIGNPVESKTK
jgi:hypothetical protein